MDMNEYALEIMVQFHLAEMRAKAERAAFPTGRLVSDRLRVGISGALVRVGNVLLGLRGLSW
jgi:hypothetical protein